MDSGLRRNDEFEYFSSANKCFAKASAFQWRLNSGAAVARGQGTGLQAHGFALFGGGKAAALLVVV